MTKNYFFTAIAGNGMQPLALLLKASGANVSGSDIYFDKGVKPEVRKELEDAGIKIFPEDGSGINENTDEIIINRIIPETQKDLAKARKLNIPSVLRPKKLAEFFSNYRLVGVAGTAGKTTTTAMVGHILKKCQKDPTIVTGSEMTNYNSRLVIGKSNIIVAEIDESGEAYKSKGFYDIISQCQPEVGIVLNVGNDHFENIEDAKAVFEDYAKNNVQKLLIKNENCKLSDNIKNQNIETVSFGTCSCAKYFITDIKSSSNGLTFKVNNLQAQMPIIGYFNAYNATSAIAAAANFDITSEEAIEALKDFKGTKQRLSICDNKDGVTSICDFAHTVEEIEASLSALQEIYKRVFLMYQPHGMVSHTHMKDKMPDLFNKLLRKEDKLYLMDTYLKTKEFESSKIVADKITNGEFLDKLENLKDRLPNLKEGDAVVIMGARDPELFPFAEKVLKD
ncbi:MAG: Mur ligase family protein [Alphaproteobacteria bacterium]|nr:Mur ligase family protein [Alphaproteobacteria bacterium]